MTATKQGKSRKTAPSGVKAKLKTATARVSVSPTGAKARAIAATEPVAPKVKPGKTAKPLAPERIAPIFDMFDKVVLQKTASYSFYQRSMWTRTGWQAFLDTGGLGAGLGSLRTSNWSISIIGSTGVFGALLLIGFFLQKLLQRTSRLSREDAAFAFGLKLSLLPYLAMIQLGGTIPDIGVAAAMSLGFLSSAPNEAAGRLRDRQSSFSSSRATDGQAATRGADS